jgi:protein-S-isoprenylcysteine O-methyltransferase Ste14
MNIYKIKPPTYLLIAIVAAITLHFFLPVTILMPSPWTLLGIFPIVLGITVSISAEQSFHQAHTTVNPFGASSLLVTNGLYRLTRNPMYLGFVLVLVGVAILLGSLMPYVIVLTFAFLLDRMFIRMEEQKLAATFGIQWEEYKRQTRRWL